MRIMLHTRCVALFKCNAPLDQPQFPNNLPAIQPAICEICVICGSKMPTAAAIGILVATGCRAGGSVGQVTQHTQYAHRIPLHVQTVVLQEDIGLAAIFQFEQHLGIAV